MKIAFIGDSYCADFGPDSYIDIVLRHFNNGRFQPRNLITTGLKGYALYHSYKQLFARPVPDRIERLNSRVAASLRAVCGKSPIDEADYIVFCITSTDRLPTRHNMPCMSNLVDFYLDPEQDINSQVPPGNTTELDDFLEHYALAPWPVMGKEKIYGKEILKAAKDFYEYLYDPDVFARIQVGLLMQMDQLMLQNKKKCIWFECSPEAFQEFRPASGPYSNRCLYDISTSEPDHPLMKFTTDHRTVDTRNNHLNTENNLKLANLIINIIETDNFNAVPFEIEEYFYIHGDGKRYLGPQM
tara:strand:+ start:78 stop:974 length:897 start_codon:yes stop_codon:yes gene_type:complete